MIRPIAAVSALALAAALAMGAAKPPPSAEPPAAYKAMARDILAELIGINTTHDVGTMKAAEAVVARLKAAGFADSDIQLLAVDGHPTQGNVVVRLKGKGKGKPVLFECHLDVVEAKPEDWTLPPFRLTEKDGYFYGRGAIDMKNEDAAVLTGLIRLKAEKFVPDRDIIVVFTSDEEGGDANGVDWLLKTHRPLVEAEFAVNTESGGGMLAGGKRMGYGVQTSEKTYVTYQLEVTNKGGHSSTPEPDNAIYRLSEGLVRFSHYVFPARLNETVKGYFRFNAKFQTGQLQADMLSVGSDKPDPAALARLGADYNWSHKLHTTCVATMAQAGHAENALPQRARTTIQCRMMPGDTEAETKARIEAALADPEIKVSVIVPAQESAESPVKPSLMKAVNGVVGGLWPGVETFTTMDSGASDGLFSRAAGIPTYGLSGNFYEVEDNRAHGRDERVLVKSFYEDVEFNYRLMKALSAAGAFG